ncbi:beta-ketoacyl synthase chain length factor [Longispora sp. NPDC051575]|uniref:beta-ketoacyl synthase N-terminal-like domain-containing protein n=1 Tax=Longispora sp. NPDC051575 TaxID=3154943 RepID=UPI0034320FF6
MTVTVLTRAEWPGTGEPPALARFVVSSFSPLVAEAARLCLTAHYGPPPVPADEGARTAVVLVSTAGDIVSGREVADLVDSGGNVSPLLFFQSVPNAVLGHVATRWGLTGPVVCVSPAGDPTADALDLVDLMFAAGDADRALVVLVEQSTTPGTPDRAVALLVKPGGHP